jgi:putative nucleotidyltransferase with HDIG domain
VNLFRYTSINVKIGALLFATILGSLALTGTLTYWHLRLSTLEKAGDSLNKVAATAALAFEGLEGDESSVEASDLLKKIWLRNHISSENRLNNLRLYRMDFDRWMADPITCFGRDADQCESRAITKDMQTAFTNNSVVRWSGCAGSCLTAAMPIRMNDEALWMLTVEVDINLLQKQLNRSLRIIILAGLLGLALSSLGAWWVTQHLTRPLLAFASVMQIMRSTGDYSIKIDLHPEDKEMNVVEDSFQRLISSVRESRQKLETSYMATLKALVMALDIRDNETAGHSLRVQRYALSIAETLRLPAAARHHVETGALLHDIGKIGVPDAILRKNGRLEQNEWVEMRKHPELGRRMVEDIEFLRPSLEVVYCHHERWDGKGYPQGLKAEEIPVSARIFAVADAFDSLTSDRVYRRATSFAEARVEIKACSGTHFDPVVAKAFMSIPDAALMRIRRETMREAQERHPGVNTGNTEIV